ncbi:MAG: hypothetical protein K2Z81_03290 [Cyanobacteria bacterium]|nr:hypothetical protein [Cyanobacteriota bacterium]
MDELSYSTDPVILLLPNNQKVVLSSIQKKEELKERNFIFAAVSPTPPITDDTGNAADASNWEFWNSELITIVSCLIGVMVIVLLFYRCADKRARGAVIDRKDLVAFVTREEDDEEAQRLLADAAPMPAGVMEEGDQRTALLSPLLNKKEREKDQTHNHEETRRNGSWMEKKERIKVVRGYSPPPAEISSAMLIPSSSSSSAASFQGKSDDEDDEVFGPRVEGGMTLKKRNRSDFGPAPTMSVLMNSTAAAGDSHETLFAVPQSPKRSASAKSRQAVTFQKTAEVTQEGEEDDDDDLMFDHQSEHSTYSMLRSRTQSENLPDSLYHSTSSSSHNEDVSDRSGNHMEEESDDNSTAFSAFSNSHDNEEFFLLKVDENEK